MLGKRVAQPCLCPSPCSARTPTAWSRSLPRPHRPSYPKSRLPCRLGQAAVEYRTRDSRSEKDLKYMRQDRRGRWEPRAAVLNLGFTRQDRSKLCAVVFTAVQARVLLESRIRTARFTPIHGGHAQYFRFWATPTPYIYATRMVLPCKSQQVGYHHGARYDRFVKRLVDLGCRQRYLKTAAATPV